MKTDIISEDNGSFWYYMCGLVEILCVLEEKIGLVCWQLLNDLHAMDILSFKLSVNFMYFLSKSMKLCTFYDRIRSKRVFQRDPCLKQLFGWLYYELNAYV